MKKATLALCDKIPAVLIIKKISYWFYIEGLLSEVWIFTGLNLVIKFIIRSNKLLP